MKVEVRLFASLRKYMPAAGGEAGTSADLPDGATIADVLAMLGIPPEVKLMLLVDGIHERDTGRRLREGSTLSVFPPIAGGSGRHRR